MSRVRLYFQASQIQDQMDIFDKEIAHKIKDVLRLRVDDEIFLFDGEGKEYSFKIIEIKNKFIKLEKSADTIKKEKPLIRIVLAFPVIKEEKIEFILQKATELGVDEFSPFICRHSIQKEPSENKFSRWERIAVEAARQSERLWLPRIHPVNKFSNLVQSEYDLKLAGVIGGQDLKIVKFPQKGSILLILGPEGDWSPEEVILLEENDFFKVNLSDNILRSETAAVFFSGMVKYLTLV
jgi:16S rRNA (uracil1498-N3)-methyltransferase